MPRYLLRDRDGIYGGKFREAATWLGIREVLTAPQSPWQNPYVERLIGSIRRDRARRSILRPSLVGRNQQALLLFEKDLGESLFKSQGMRSPTPRIQMLDGFNEGRIEFQGGHAGPRKGNVTLEAVLRTLIERESKL